MRVIFVRHGYPNYEKDCLTDVGHLHAQAAAERLADEPFSRVFSSTCGRAVETAEHIAAKHDLPVESFDFMREITWGPIEGETLPHKNGYPWVVSTLMPASGTRSLPVKAAPVMPTARNIKAGRSRKTGSSCCRNLPIRQFWTEMPNRILLKSPAKSCRTFAFWWHKAVDGIRKLIYDYENKALRRNQKWKI